MALVVGTNSWATIVEADAYLTDRVGAEDWFDLVDSGDPGAVSKTTLLVTAFFRLSSAYSIPSDSTDENIKRAQIEAAYFLMDNYVEFEERDKALSAGVEAFRQSQWSENYEDGAEVEFPSFVLKLIKTYSGGSHFPQLLGEDYE